MTKTNLRYETLEETPKAFILGHVRQNSEPTLRVLEVPVLDTGLDHIKRGRDD